MVPVRLSALGSHVETDCPGPSSGSFLCHGGVVWKHCLLLGATLFGAQAQNVGMHTAVGMLLHGLAHWIISQGRPALGLSLGSG